MNRLRNVLIALILLAAVILGVLFSLQNTRTVPLDLLIFTFEPRSLALWILAAFALGGLTGLLISSAYILRSRAALGSARRKLTRARTELDQLRSTEPEPGG